MIQLNNVSLSFGSQILFHDISTVIMPGQKVGLVGRNGTGKSTLLHVLAGLQDLDGGNISIQKGVNIAYMPQEVALTSCKSVLHETLRACGPVLNLIEERKVLEGKLEMNQATDHDVERYGILLHECDEHEVEKKSLEAEKILTGLGFDGVKMHGTVDQLSSGWKMRIVLAQLLLHDADFYLFDEPTNHLDMVAKEWFAQFLKETNTGFLLVTHDRYFLDTTVSEIIELDRGSMNRYPGNYSHFLTAKESADQILKKRHAEQNKEIRKKLATAERFRAKSSKAKMAQRLLREVDQMERVELPHETHNVSFQFDSGQRPGKIILTVDNLAIGYDEKIVLKDLSFEIKRGEKVALVAANGVGKTTLFKTLTGQLKPQGGEIEFGHNVEMAYFEQDQDKVLDPSLSILTLVENACTTTEQRKKVRGLLGTFLFPGDDVYKKVGVLSGGERNRVAMVKILLEGANFLMLDEPTNHLDLQSKEVLLSALQQYKGTLLFVSHDRLFLENLATRIIELSPRSFCDYPGTYEEFLYYKSQKIGSHSEQKYDGSAQKTRKNRHLSQQALNNRKTQKLESTIEKKEAELARLRHSFVTLAYGSNEYVKSVQEMERCEKSLQSLYDEWEMVLKE